MNLKDRKLQEAKTKLKVLEEKLKFLEFSNLQDKEEKIIDCKHAIEKQKRINTKCRKLLLKATVSYFMALFFYF